MKHKLVLASIVGLLAMLCASMAAAQDPRLSGVVSDKFVISAKAGGVNFLSGTVTVIRTDGTSGHLVAGEALEIGDRVTTGPDSMAEILLNPGSYLRVGGNTSFEFISTDLDNLKVDLNSGSAVFEVYAADEFRVSVKMPKTEISLTRTGVYRLDVAADGLARLSVFKGKAFVGPSGQIGVDSGQTAALVQGGISVEKFDRDSKDPLDVWSKDRAKELTKSNATLKRDPMYDTLMSSYNQHGWNMYDSFGLWVFDPVRRMWLFMPFGYGWSSPYGWDYDFSVYSCRLPWYVYRRPSPPSGGGVGVSPGPTVTPIKTAQNRGPIPPFERMGGNGGARTGSGRSIENGSGGSGIGSSSNDGGSISNSNRGRDISSPASSAPTRVVVSQPTPTQSRTDSPIKKP
jgi:hypothetical protein